MPRGGGTRSGQGIRSGHRYSPPAARPILSAKRTPRGKSPKRAPSRRRTRAKMAAAGEEEGDVDGAARDDGWTTRANAAVDELACVP